MMSDLLKTDLKYHASDNKTQKKIKKVIWGFQNPYTKKKVSKKLM